MIQQRLSWDEEFLGQEMLEHVHSLQMRRLITRLLCKEADERITALEATDYFTFERGPDLSGEANQLEDSHSTGSESSADSFRESLSSLTDGNLFADR